MTTVRGARSLPMIPALETPRARLLVVLGDDELVSGHRASHWTGVAPGIELDLAMATLSQNGVNAADLWYQVLLGAELSSDDPEVRTQVDAIALGRQPDQYRHAVLAERPPRDIAFSLARVIATDHASAVRLDALSESSDQQVAQLARKLRWELRYHLDHAAHWVAALARARPDHRRRFVDALAVVVAEANGIFEAFPGEDEVVASGVLPVAHAELRGRWAGAMRAVLEPFDLVGLLEDTAVPEAAAGGRSGSHTPDFTDDLWPEMTALYRSDPGASW